MAASFTAILSVSIALWTDLAPKLKLTIGCSAIDNPTLIIMTIRDVSEIIANAAIPISPRCCIRVRLNTRITIPTDSSDSPSDEPL